MSSVIVNTGELFVGQSPAVIESLGIGSCVVVCLYDKSKKTGGLAHIMLPKDDGKDNLSSLVIDGQTQFEPLQPAKYADTGLDQLISKLLNLGSSFSGLTAKIVGGAEMFTIHKNQPETIGSQNVTAVKQKLRETDIKIIFDDTDGNVGRSVKFFLETGVMEIRKKNTYS